MAQVPAGQADRSRGRCSISAPQAAADPDFLLEIEHVKQWEAEPRPAARGRLAALPDRLGRAVRQPGSEFLNANETGPHTPGISVACAQWLAAELADHRAGGRDRRHRRGRRALLRPAVPLPLGPARGGQVRPDPAAEPGPAAGHRRGRDRRPAADHRRFGSPVPRARPRGAFLIMRVANAVGRDLARLGRGHRVRRGRQRELPRHERADRRRGAFHRRPARGRRRRHGRRLGPDLGNQGPPGRSASCPCTRDPG